MSEPWTEVDVPEDAPPLVTRPRAIDVSVVDTSRLTDPFSRLLFYHTVQERTDAQRRLVELTTDILKHMTQQHVSAEVVRNMTHIWSLDDMDLLHLAFFFLLFSAPPVLQRVIDMTDKSRFHVFATWLMDVLYKTHARLGRENGRKLAHAIRLQWSLLC